MERARRNITGAARVPVRSLPRRALLELNILLYAGVLAFVGGLGWTVSTWSQQIGDVLVLTFLSVLLGSCFWYCFSRALAWTPAESPPPSLIFEYVLYLGSLTWSVELAYVENRFHLLSGQWDGYLLATAALFFFLAYRFETVSSCRSPCPRLPGGSALPSRTGPPKAMRLTGRTPLFTA